MTAQSIQSLHVERVPLARRGDCHPSAVPAEERANKLTFDLFETALAHPETAERFQQGVMVALIPENDPEVAALNLQAVARARRKGQPVQFLFLDASGRVPGATTYEFAIDLRDERWGQQPRPELDGRTAAELRAILAEVARASQEEAPVRLAYENIVVLNGVRVYVLDEPEPGLYQVIAFERRPWNSATSRGLRTED